MKRNPERVAHTSKIQNKQIKMNYKKHGANLNVERGGANGQLVDRGSFQRHLAENVESVHRFVAAASFAGATWATFGP